MWCVWMVLYARYDTQLLSGNITVGRGENILRQLLDWSSDNSCGVRPSCSEEKITKLVLCSGIYYWIAVLGLFHHQHICVIQIGYIPIYPTLWYVHKEIYRNALSKASIRWETSAKKKSETRNLAVPIGIINVTICLNDFVLRSQDGCNAIIQVSSSRAGGVCYLRYQWWER